MRTSFWPVQATVGMGDVFAHCNLTARYCLILHTAPYKLWYDTCTIRFAKATLVVLLVDFLSYLHIVLVYVSFFLTHSKMIHFVAETFLSLWQMFAKWWMCPLPSFNSNWKTSACCRAAFWCLRGHWIVMAWTVSILSAVINITPLEIAVVRLSPPPQMSIQLTLWYCDITLWYFVNCLPLYASLI